MKFSSPYSISTRALVNTNKSIEEKINRVTVVKKDVAVLFSNILFQVRRSLKHRGITLITSTSRDWLQLKKVADNAESFSDDFELEYREGFQIYCRIGIKMMKNKYSLNKFLAIHEKICQEYEATLATKTDKYPLVTRELCEYFNREVLDQTGIEDDVSKNSEYLMSFIEVAEYITVEGISAEDYIKAQFDGLSFTGGIPYPSQLIGDKAIERLYRYLKKKEFINSKSSTNKKKKSSWLDMSKLKSMEE